MHEQSWSELLTRTRNRLATIMINRPMERASGAFYRTGQEPVVGAKGNKDRQPPATRFCQYAAAEDFSCGARRPLHDVFSAGRRSSTTEHVGSISSSSSMTWGGSSSKATGAMPRKGPSKAGPSGRWECG